MRARSPGSGRVHIVLPISGRRLGAFDPNRVACVNTSLNVRYPASLQRRATSGFWPILLKNSSRRSESRDPATLQSPAQRDVRGQWIGETSGTQLSRRRRMWHRKRMSAHSVPSRQKYIGRETEFFNRIGRTRPVSGQAAHPDPERPNRPTRKPTSGTPEANTGRTALKGPH